MMFHGIKTEFGGVAMVFNSIAISAGHELELGSKLGNNQRGIDIAWTQIQPSLMKYCFLGCCSNSWY